MSTTRKFVNGMLLIACIAAWIPVAAQGTDPQKEIPVALRAADVQGLARFFDLTIDLNLPGNENTYSKSQAELILKEFFLKNPPSSFTINHNGSSRDGSLYFIGTYLSTHNKSFRTYYLLKKSGDKLLIKQLQFEPD